MSKNDGGPAFPGEAKFNPWPDGPRIDEHGMKLRDWLAGQALTGMDIPGTEHDEDVARFGFRAAAAYRMADAMLAARVQE